MIGEVVEDAIHVALKLALTNHRDEERAEGVRVAAEGGRQRVAHLHILLHLVEHLAQERVGGLRTERLEDLEDVDVGLRERGELPADDREVGVGYRSGILFGHRGITRKEVPRECVRHLPVVLASIR